MFAMKYDAAINKHDAAAIAALYTQDAVWATYHFGVFHGRQKIEKAYAYNDFIRWNKQNYATTVNRVTVVGARDGHDAIDSPHGYHDCPLGTAQIIAVALPIYAACIFLLTPNSEKHPL
jgi:hypothetical protein